MEFVVVYYFNRSQRPDMAQSKKRARQQATEMEVPDYIHSGGEYNIWYHKRLGDRPVRRTEPSTTRCDPEKDSGRTKADSLPGRHYLCLYFARGKCVHGYKCQYYHRIPTIEDERSLPITHDIFGRERHAYVFATFISRLIQYSEINTVVT